MTVQQVRIRQSRRLKEIVLLIDMKIYLGDRFLWRIFTYNFYMKIILGFLSKVFTYNQGTKPATLCWSQKAPFFFTRKNRHLLDTKNAFFSHRPPLFFRRRTSKKRRKFDPLRDGSDAIIRISIRGKETCIRKDSPQKNRFLGIFRNVKYTKMNFPGYS